ncbi:MAG: hypothetical protein M1826_007176 [Phylliscum demangeonii]|nr:MAG: hypothetical protein M1826_007176 [Phylliscum demangeonii]
MTTLAEPASPSSSTRLPSPPPLTEVQFGPQSPKLATASHSTGSNITGSNGDIAGFEPAAGSHRGQEGLDGAAPKDVGPSRRIRPGTTAEDMASGPPMIPLNELDSAFQLQEHLQSLYTQCTHTPSSAPRSDGQSQTTGPITHATALALATPPDGVDRSLWLYELCRLLTNKLNAIIVAFFNEEPPCSAATCGEMRADEWQYLCAVHDPPKPCCAIDYCCHTLDWAANMLTSTKHFPSRLSLGAGAEVSGHAGGVGTGDGSGSGSGSGNGNGTNAAAPHARQPQQPYAHAQAQQQGLRHLTNIFRRLYRIFAHAWYQHRAVFWQVEGQTGLYVFFKTVCDVYQLIPHENYTIPAEAEGGGSTEDDAAPDGAPGSDSGGRVAAPIPALLKRDEVATPPSKEADHDATRTKVGMATARRHLPSLSIGSLPSSSGAVTTVPEEDEEEDDEPDEDEEDDDDDDDDDDDHEDAHHEDDDHHDEQHRTTPGGESRQAEGDPSTISVSVVDEAVGREGGERAGSRSAAVPAVVPQKPEEREASVAESAAAVAPPVTGPTSSHDSGPEASHPSRLPPPSPAPTSTTTNAHPAFPSPSTTKAGASKKASQDEPKSITHHPARRNTPDQTPAPAATTTTTAVVVVSDAPAPAPTPAPVEHSPAPPQTEDPLLPSKHDPVGAEEVVVVVGEEKKEAKEEEEEEEEKEKQKEKQDQDSAAGRERSGADDDGADGVDGSAGGGGGGGGKTAVIPGSVRGGGGAADQDRQMNSFSSRR